MQDLNGKRRIVTYERVSSEDQRERETIKTQTQELARRLEDEPGVELIERYVDDGVSGKVPMAERPAGKRLLQDAARGHFEEVWVYKIDRLGRDDVDPLIVWRDLEQLRVKVHSVTEGVSSSFEYHIRVAMAAEERRTFLARSSAGMERIAREGRYCGGIVPLGYKKDGKKHQARLVPSDIPIWRGWTEADLVRQIYDWLAVDEWSCRKIATHLNSLCVPTVYTKDSRLVNRPDGLGGKRKQRTQNKWRAGRIRNLVINTVYRGEHHYGRRSQREREVIIISVPPLVSKEIWDAAQRTLAANRIMPKNAKHSYLLRGLITCGTCGLRYCGSMNREVVWYRCNGQLIDRGPIEGRCPGKSFRGDSIEPTIIEDVKRFLWEPGSIVEELQNELLSNGAAAAAEAERVTLEAALDDTVRQRDVMLDALRQGDITREEFAAQADKIAEDRNTIEKRLRELAPPEDEPGFVGEDLLAEIRQRVEAGLSMEQWQEVIRALVCRITIHTDIASGRKTIRAVVEYRFPAVVNNHSDRGSSRPPA